MGLETSTPQPVSAYYSSFQLGKVWNVDDEEAIPNPRIDASQCTGAGEYAWLCLLDDVLEQNKVNSLEQSLESIVNQSGKECLCQELQEGNCTYTGIPVIVIVVKGFSFNSGNETKDEKRDQVLKLAKNYNEEWQYDTCDDGIIFFVSLDDALVVPVVGQSAQKVFTRDCQTKVEDSVTHLFDEHRFDEGLQELIGQLHEFLVSREVIISDSEKHLNYKVVIPIICIIVAVIGAIIIAICLMLYRRRGSENIKTDADVPLKQQELA